MATAAVLSLCTTCRNRLWQLRQTLAPNLAHLADAPVPAELSLVDFGSTDGMAQWVWSEFGEPIETGRLRFFEVSAPTAWHASRAKNLAHRLATGSYLFNLDADNFVEPADLHVIARAAEAGVACSQFSGQWVDGSYGRVGMPAALFHRLGGYDESLLPMSGQDVDVIKRILTLDLPVRKLRAPARMAVQNTRADKVAELGVAPADAGPFYEAMRDLNSRMSAFKLRAEGPCRPGLFATYKGRLNGTPVTFDGVGQLHHGA